MTMATLEQNRKNSLLPRMRGPRHERKETLEEDTENQEIGAHKRARSSESFQDKFLAAKLKKEEGLAEQAEIEAKSERIDYSEKVGRLLTMAKAQDMLEQEHVMWITEVGKLPADIIRRYYKKGVSMDTQEIVKKHVEEAVHDLLKRLSRV